MIDRARTALSGVVVSVLLMGPLVPLAAHAQGGVPSQSPTPAAERKSALNRPVRHIPVAAPARTRTAHLRRGPGIHPVAGYASARSGSARTAAFVDDGAATGPGDSRPHQHGLASWYGDRWHGRRTASGSIFDQDGLTAAHPSLPLGSRVRVSLVGSDRDVIVTITDRPGTRSRIIDLSRGAARELGILERGVAMVTLTQL